MIRKEKIVLTIKNFGPIHDVSFEEKPLVVFIGSQGTGKSTIAKLLTISHDLLWYFSVAKGNDGKSIFAQLGIKQYFRDNTYLHYEDGVLGYTYENGKFSLSVDEIAQDNLVDFFSSFMKKVSIDLVSKCVGNINEESIEKFLNENKILIRTNFRSVCYIPTERNLAAILSESLANIFLHKIPLPTTILEYLSFYEKARKEFDSYTSDFLDVTYSAERSTENILIDKATNKWLSLKECSSGVQSTLPMLMIIDYCRKVNSFDYFVVEEPEENLFPLNQYELVLSFVSHINENNPSTFCLNTHSPYLLSAINNCILAYKIGTNPKYAAQVEQVIPRKYWLDSKDVSVFALGDKENNHFKNVMNERTGLISGNFLDSASEVINSDFQDLYKIYVNSLQDE